MSTPSKVIRASSSSIRSFHSSVLSRQQRSFCQILQKRQDVKRSIPSLLHDTTQRFSSSSSFASEDLSAIPTKETLLRIDWLLEDQVPKILKSRLGTFYEACEDNLTFEDTLFNYKISSKAQLLSHLAKVKLYLRYKSPFNKIEYIGSCIYDGEDVVTILWRFSTLESSFWTYFPSFLGGKDPKTLVQEGSLDVHVTRQGKIYRLVNRKITAADREGAKIMKAFKEEGSEARATELEKQAKQKLDDEFHLKRGS